LSTMRSQRSTIGLCVTLLALTGSVCAAQALSYKTSWIGNSFGGVKHVHVQDDILGMFVASDGTCYTDSIWDEGGSEAGIYKDGAASDSLPNLHGWGRGGGAAVCADSSYVYLAMTQSGDDGANKDNNSNGLPEYPPQNNVWYCVRRYTRAGAESAFPTGLGVSNDILRVNSGSRPKSGSPYSGSAVSGVAVDATSLYVSDPTADRIKKYALDTLAETPIESWRVQSPGQMTMDSSGNLWVVQGSAIAKVLKFSPDGALLASISFARDVVPSGIAYNAKSGMLMVTDRGSDENVKEYNTAKLSGNPTVVAATFGVKGGVYAGTLGQIGPKRFNDPSGVGTDSDGNIYVSSNGQSSGGGTVLECYTSSGTRKWVLKGLEFVDGADPDPGSDTDVYTKEEHFAMNYASTAPGSEATYKGYTIDPFKYPEDPRMHIANGGTGVFTRRIHGKTFLFITDMYSDGLEIFRFNPATDGECAIPSGMFAKRHRSSDRDGFPENQPDSGEWIWRDSNGNGSLDSGEFHQPATVGDAPSLWGWFVDSNGDVWQAMQGAGIRHFTCQGLDGKGNPIYDYQHMTTARMPAEFTDLERIQYDSSTDTMYLGGYGSGHPNPPTLNRNGDWGLIGTILCRYDHWSANTTVHRGYPIVLPYDDAAKPALQPKALSIAGSYVFVAYGIQNIVQVFNKDTGVQVGTLTPGDSVGGKGSLGWVDFPDALQAWQRKDGEYLIFDEDDWLGKIVLYRF